MLKELTIGRVAKQSGVGVETVRFYERKGLIQQPQRGGESSFRTYSQEDPLRIRFIKRAQNLGFTLNEIKQLLALNANPRTSCAEVKKRADAKIEEVSAKIADLKKIKRSLQELSMACGRGKQAVSCCNVTDCFEGKGRC